MNIRQKIIAARNALNYGEQLANAATWKQRTARSTAIVGLLTASLPFLDAFGALDSNALREAAHNIALGIDGLWFLFNGYMHYATSVKVGFNGPSQLD